VILNAERILSDEVSSQLVNVGLDRLGPSLHHGFADADEPLVRVHFDDDAVAET
jgi:hypothetical protein